MVLGGKSSGKSEKKKKTAKRFFWSRRVFNLRQLSSKFTRTHTHSFTNTKDGQPRKILRSLRVGAAPRRPPKGPTSRALASANFAHVYHRRRRHRRRRKRPFCGGGGDRPENDSRLFKRHARLYVCECVHNTSVVYPGGGGGG